jgi:uncharacterized surface protein with fasciclin (FAS1) repeats
MRLQPPPAPELPRRDILDTLHALGSCRTLLQLVSAAGFVEDLGGSGQPLTLFAPSDAAFARIEGSGRALLDPGREEMLIDLLEYHLVRGRVDLGVAIAVGGLRTVHGAELHLRAEGGGTWIDAARVHAAGIECSNGVVYVVDDVLAPALSEVRAWIAARTASAAEPNAWDARTCPRGSFAALDDLLPPRGLDLDLDEEVEAAAPPGSALPRALAFAAESRRFSPFAGARAPIPLLPD